MCTIIIFIVMLRINDNPHSASALRESIGIFIGNTKPVSWGFNGARDELFAFTFVLYSNDYCTDVNSFLFLRTDNIV